jgi:hypothetical protein
VPVSQEPIAETTQHNEHPSTTEETAEPVAEMENSKPHPTPGEKSVQDTLIDTKDGVAETSVEEAELPEAEEHHMITPAHTNTPAGERIEDEEDAVVSAEGVENPEHVQLNGQPLPEEASSSPAAEDDNARAQHVADSISLLHPTDGAHSEEEERQPSEASLTPILPGMIEPASTPAVQVDQESLETATSPALMIEKVDDELRYEDSSSSTAEVGQKYTLPIRSAIPDHVLLRTESRTPELAETAAEVAESAALLDRDRDPPTPPISDEEAGRIGYRRMSSTPIPEVAKTAAEVADVAAKLDERPPVSP